MRASIAFALVLVACGGGSTGTTSPSTVRFDPETYFLEIAATRTDLVVAPDAASRTSRRPRTPRAATSGARS
ncbi:MAG: hypothetical protein H6722_24675 [Sandaracinus sp.]|nr:hypothetical protein [Sandaracinus sp.]